METQTRVTCFSWWLELSSLLALGTKGTDVLLWNVGRIPTFSGQRPLIPRGGTPHGGPQHVL